MKTIFETLSAFGACHVTIIGGVVYTKIFETFENISTSFFIFHREIFFRSKILSSTYDKTSKV